MHEMKVWFDHQVFAAQVHGGISRYFINLATEFQRYGDPDLSIVAPLHVNSGLGQLEPRVVKGIRVPAVPYTGRLLKSVNQALTRVLLTKHAPHIYHATYYRPLEGGVQNRKCALVVTVHDMIHEKYPKFFLSRDRTAAEKARAVSIADHVICVSRSTRDDLLEKHAIDPAKVSVVYHGPGLTVDNSGSKSPVDGPYLLHVGARGGYKNFHQLLRVFASSSRVYEDVSLVSFGGGPLTGEERETMRSQGLSESRVFTLSGDDRALSCLYRHAAALVFPSLYEGFGLPVLEAMAHDCPVITTSNGSLGEVAGNGAAIFDPDDDESLLSAIERLLEDAEFRGDLVARGQQRVSQFSWEKCAKQTLDLYRSLI